VDGLEQVLGEAKALLADRASIKSESGQATIIVIIRALKAIVHGRPLTPYPAKHPKTDLGSAGPTISLFDELPALVRKPHQIRGFAPFAASSFRSSGSFPNSTMC
jgi:hypothetical protein